MRGIFSICSFALALALVLACTRPVAAQSSAVADAGEEPALAMHRVQSEAIPPGSGQVDLVHGTLLRDGRPWQMRGVGISGVVTPVRQLGRPFVGERLRQAHAGFGA